MVRLTFFDIRDNVARHVGQLLHMLINILIFASGFVNDYFAYEQLLLFCQQFRRFGTTCLA